MKYKSGTQVTILEWEDLEGNLHMVLAKAKSITTTIPDFNKQKEVTV